MLLAPSRSKFRKQHRGRMRGKAHRGATIAFGEYGLQALEPCWLESRQIEAARIALTRFMKRGGKVWIRVFPDKPISGKPAETRMGSGKGALDHWVAVVKPGRIIFEISGVSEEVAKEAIRLAGHKLPIDCRFVKREETESVEA
jgi:large subunit ribosomal protein L16